MSNKTRKHIWPVSLVMSIAIIGALAAFLVLACNPGATDAHGGTPHDCSGLSAANQGLRMTPSLTRRRRPVRRIAATGNGNGEAA